MKLDVPKLSDELRFLERYKEEIQPVVAAEEANLLDHLYDGILTEQQIEKILKEQETKVFVWDRPGAKADAIKTLLVGRDPGAAIGIKTLLEAMQEYERVGSIGVIVDGVAQHYLHDDVKNFKKIDENPLVLADIMTSANKPYDVIVNTGSATNNPASVTLENRDLLTHGRPDAKSYFVYEAYEWGVSQDYYTEVEHMDGIFCNDELAKKILENRFPNYAPDHIHVTGTGQTDSIKPEQAEKLYRSGREKLSIPTDTFTVIYLGTISKEYEMYGLDSEVDEKSWLRTIKGMSDLADKNPEQSYFLLYRPHPRDPNREKKFDLSKELQIPSNLSIDKATSEAGLSMDEAIYASNAIASMTLTENFKATHRNRQGIYLGFNDPGMGGDYLEKNYSPDIVEAMQTLGGVKIVHTDDDFSSYLASIKDRPIEQPKVRPGVTSAHRMLEIILKDQKARV